MTRQNERVKISKLYEFDGLNKVEVKSATIGAIVAISRYCRYPHWRYTLCREITSESIPFQKILSLHLHELVNDSPLAGQEGKFITSVTFVTASTVS